MEMIKLVFQSPSLRGSGRFSAHCGAGSDRLMCFNPLHCGAVVALKAPLAARRGRARFQSPSLRGSGRLVFALWGWANTVMVSIPFIAGQWSLGGGGRRRRAAHRGFNPLHCGAVVAYGVDRSCGADRRGFNPLHCGAVVACGAAPGGGAPDAVFQSPSLRGSGRLRAARRPTLAIRRVSIPFIAGQWSLGDSPSDSVEGLPFQSPSLRGSGRLHRLWALFAIEGCLVSIPFIAGQWSLYHELGGESI